MWVEMLRLHADAERSVGPGQRAQFPNETAEKLIADGAAVQCEGPDGEIRTRPVEQPARGGRGKAPAKKPAAKQPPETGGGQGQGDGQGDGTQQPPAE
ncbi:hypothetical protein Aple_010700 [Acrocarpospora pleiomorpha]|uniref:Uncharacterized protein n=1 Tax=Acrocarpospora pleiomorpha TaxID=90975 RepID=A0A5M3X8Y1_9ACTN|nr:hypothetical protein [Acrocarpospora pleiomorpha]GES18175.1 hypothetical protein Aple_010700 [Acrocarpospora pleiomorpha]